jgi:hypothetical protein
VPKLSIARGGGGGTLPRRPRSCPDETGECIVTRGSWPGPEDGSSGSAYPEELWERFLTDNERNIAATAPKELSARARVAARRIREEKERAAARGDRRPGPPGRPRPAQDRLDLSSATAAARRAARAAEDAKERRKRRWINAVGVLLVLATLAFALTAGRVWPVVTGEGGRGSTAAPTSTLPPETARPAGPPAAVPEQRATLQRPFAGSPAEAWGDGAAAIVPPAAIPYFAVTRDRVADGLRLAKDLMVATGLDPAVLAGGSTDAVSKLIDAHSGGARGTLADGLAHPTAADDPTALLSRFGPEARLVGDTVKVRGRMTLGVGDTYGGARILADYTFVYPVRRASDTGASPEITRTVVRRTVTVELPADVQRPARIDSLLLAGWTAQIAGVDCGVHDGFLHPSFDGGGARVAAPAHGPGVDPYDRSKPVADGTGTLDCVRALRV